VRDLSLSRLRLLKIQELVKEAEELAKEESRLQHNDRRLTRLAALMWLGRDMVDDVVEEIILKPEPPEGRQNREH
jgi:hypothetical protein